MIKPLAVVFDMDGVLLDTEQLFARYWAESLLALGYTPKDAAILGTLGVSSQDSPAIFCAHYGPDFPYRDCALTMVKLYKAHIHTHGVPVKPGATAILQRLKALGLPLGLASSNQRQYVESQLASVELLGYFDALVCGDDVPRSKPDPAIYITACKKLGVSPRDAYALEDAPAGVRSARLAGMQVLMVPDMLEPDKETRSLTTSVLPNLTAALAYLEKAMA